MRVIPPAHLRIVSAPARATATHDSISRDQNIVLDAPIAKLVGTVFLDKYGNTERDKKEHFLAGVTVVLDSNNNGKADPGEPTRLSDEQDRYQFFVPYGASRLLFEPSGRQVAEGIVATEQRLSVGTDVLIKAPTGLQKINGK